MFVGTCCYPPFFYCTRRLIGCQSQPFPNLNFISPLFNKVFSKLFVYHSQSKLYFTLYTDRLYQHRNILYLFLIIYLPIYLWNTLFQLISQSSNWPICFLSFSPNILQDLLAPFTRVYPIFFIPLKSGKHKKHTYKKKWVLSKASNYYVDKFTCLISFYSCSKKCQTCKILPSRDILDYCLSLHSISDFPTSLPAIHTHVLFQGCSPVRGFILGVDRVVY